MPRKRHRATELRRRVRRFRATIYRQGPNPHVDVPESVSRAFAAWGQAGRIIVVGTLNKVPIRATLIPVGRGRHRLYVNGGMKSWEHRFVLEVCGLQPRRAGFLVVGLSKAPRRIAERIRRGYPNSRGVQEQPRATLLRGTLLQVRSFRISSMCFLNAGRSVWVTSHTAVKWTPM